MVTFRKVVLSKKASSFKSGVPGGRGQKKKKKTQAHTQNGFLFCRRFFGPLKNPTIV